MALRAALFLALLPLTGCLPFECIFERIEVSFEVEVESESARILTDARGTLAPGNVDDYEPIKEVVVGDSRSSNWVVWTLDRFAVGDEEGPLRGPCRRSSRAPACGIEQGAIAFVAGGPFEVGEVLGLGHAGIGGWGLTSVRDEAGIQVSAGHFTSTSASGTLEVLDVEPLSLRVDAEVTDGEENLRLKGDLRFRLVSVAGACD